MLTWGTVFLMSGLFGCDEHTAISESQSPALTEVIALWKANPQAFAQRSRSLSTEERLYIVRSILTDPTAEHSPRLCQILDKQHHDYCIHTLNRSHLWDVPISLHETVENQSTPPALEACSTTDAWCRTQRAVNVIKHQEYPLAENICNTLSDRQAQEECFFEIAEQVSKQEHPTSMEKAFEYCAQTPTYSAHCQYHIIEHIAGTFHTPTAVLKTIDVRVASTQLRSKLQDYYWTLKALHAPRNTLLPHWDQHSVQTIQFLQTQQKVDLPLDVWIEKFQDARQNLPYESLTLPYPIPSYWLQQGQQQHPSTLFLSLETRPYAKDPTLDLSLAMVAGLIYLEFPTGAVQNTESSTIQWMLNRASHKR